MVDSFRFREICMVESACFACAAGRPFLMNDHAIAAGSQRGRAGAWTDSMAVPDLRGLSPAERTQLAQAWTHDALLEHASVAAFSRFSLELMAVGAAADLIALAHAAAMDEVRHARLCFALASAYRGEPIVPAPFPFGGSVSVGTDLAALAATTVKEGCIGETLAAFHAAEQLEWATDPAVRSVLSTLALDESRHAELAWRTVAWALREGGADVKRAVVDAFAAAEDGVLAARIESPAGTESEHLAAHGRPHPARLHAALARTVEQVILPCAKALLADTLDGPVAATV